MQNKDFAVFILTYGRSGKVSTYETLKKRGYTGKVYFICSDDDKELETYKRLYKEKVIVFSKKDYADTFDIGDNFTDERVVVYARNACFDLAKKVGVKYFLVLDDDYIAFHYRIYAIHKPEQIRNLDNVFDIVLDFYKNIPAKSIAMAQGGDFIGGSENKLATNPELKRKCMNSFFCSTERPFKFVGRINEDVNTYVQNATKGDLFFTIPTLSLTQNTTQANTGGLTEIYLSKGTYVKSFYSVMYTPSAVKVNLMGDKHMRLHHRVKWASAVPFIINEKHKK